VNPPECTKRPSRESRPCQVGRSPLSHLRDRNFGIRTTGSARSALRAAGPVYDWERSPRLATRERIGGRPGPRSGATRALGAAPAETTRARFHAAVSAPRLASAGFDRPSLPQARTSRTRRTRSRIARRRGRRREGAGEFGLEGHAVRPRSTGKPRQMRVAARAAVARGSRRWIFGPRPSKREDVPEARRFSARRSFAVRGSSGRLLAGSSRAPAGEGSSGGSQATCAPTTRRGRRTIASEIVEAAPAGNAEQQS